MQDHRETLTDVLMTNENVLCFSGYGRLLEGMPVSSQTKQ
jgi:hypothetical protein